MDGPLGMPCHFIWSPSREHVEAGSAIRSLLLCPPLLAKDCTPHYGSECRLASVDGRPSSHLFINTVCILPRRPYAHVTKKAVPRLREYCRQVEAEVVSNSRNLGPAFYWSPVYI